MIPFSLTISRVYILRQIKKLVLCVRGIRYTNDFGRTSACYHSERILAISFECQFGFINLDLDAVLDGDDLIRTNLARNSLAGNRIPAPPAAVAQTIHARLVCLFHDLCHRAECFTFIADAQLAAINARITNCRDAVIFQFQTERDVQRLLRPSCVKISLPQAGQATISLRKRVSTRNQSSSFGRADAFFSAFWLNACKKICCT